MAKRWSVKDDIFLVSYAAVGANYVANHDLGFQGKDAGEKRVKKLKELGLWDRINEYLEAKQTMHDAWTLEFGPEWAKEIVSDRAKADQYPWSERKVDLVMKESL